MITTERISALMPAEIKTGEKMSPEMMIREFLTATEQLMAEIEKLKKMADEAQRIIDEIRGRQ